MRKKRVKLVEVEWEDHWASASDWSERELSDPQNDYMQTTSGYLHFETEGHLIISPNKRRDSMGNVRGVSCIIKSCIRKIRVVGWRNAE